MIAAKAIDATLCRVSEHIFLEGSLANFFCDARFFGERLSCRFIFHKLNGLQQTEAAYLTPRLDEPRWKRATCAALRRQE